MIPLGPVVARSRMRAARAGVWTYVSDPERRSEWWPDLQMEGRIGGEVVERWSEGSGEEMVSRDASGRIDVWVEGHAIGFTWREAGDARDTAVLLTLRAQGEETGVTVTETGFDALPAPAERAAASQQGWEVLLSALSDAIDRGVAAGTIGADDGVGRGPAADPEVEPPPASASEPRPLAALEPSPAWTGEIELAPEEVDGEVVEVEAEIEIEVDAEPQPGEHLELDTAVVPVIGPGRSDDRDRSSDGGKDRSSDEESLTGDPDFDSLLRGL